MNSVNKKRIVSLVVVFLTLGMILVLLLSSNLFRNNNNRIKIGYVMTGSASEGGWNGMNYEGIKGACEQSGVELIIIENIPEYTGECSKAVQELVEKDAEVIFLSSFNYADEIADVIRENPEIQFYASASGNVQEKNLSVYFPRMYQARYLSGMIAGATTKSNVIGYVAAMDNSEVNRGINAFTLGVLRANPNASVVVYFTGDWNNEAVEKEAADILVREEGADVLTYHQNLAYVVEEADKLGVWSISYHIDGTEMSDKCLTGVVCDWQCLYQEIIKDYLKGINTENNLVWLGIDRHVVDLSGYGKDVSEENIAMVEKAKVELIGGKEVFSDEIIDNAGNVRCNIGEMISDSYLMDEMTWFVRGVRIYEK